MAIVTIVTQIVITLVSLYMLYRFHRFMLKLGVEELKKERNTKGLSSRRKADLDGHIQAAEQLLGVQKPKKNSWGFKR
jgi:hypothetical protein